MAAVLDIKNLTKNFGRIKAVDDLTLKVGEGAVYGILGPNGSGKTTTLGIILGAIHPDLGRYSWFGAPGLSQVQGKLGVLLEHPPFYPYLTGKQNLKLIARLRKAPLEDAARVLELLGLSSRQNSRFRYYSTGMKQRLYIASAMLGDPDILVLDEPTNGLDPQGIADVRHLIRRMAKDGKTIILASHLLDEVEKVCSHVAVLREGKLISEGRVDSVLKPSSQIIVDAGDRKKLGKLLKQHPKVTAYEETETGLEVTVKGLKPAELNAWLHDKGITVSRLQDKKDTLESHFLSLMQTPTRNP